MAKELTAKQITVLNFIRKFIAEKGYGPTVREICQGVGLSSPSTVQVHLNALERKGMINRDSQKSRSITLSDSAAEETEEAAAQAPSTGYSQGTLTLPLVGNVAAGSPILAEENIEDQVILPTSIVGDSASFMLTVHGNSMIEAGINDGDTIVVREQSTADNGDIVVALIEDGATVKRFFKEKDHIRLQPENATMDPLIVDDCAIVGKVVALFRRL